MKIAHAFRLGLLAGYCLILTGCETTVRMYPGRALPRSRVAVLELGPDVGILSMDGESFNVGKFKDVEMLPGTHAVKAVYFKASTQPGAAGGQPAIIGGLQSEQPVHLVFEAMAGRTYRIIGTLEEKVISTQGKVEIWDMVTGHVIASGAGPVQSVGARLAPAGPK